jgi:flagellar M-ring protein FliF
MDMQGNLLIRPKKPGDGSEPSQELLAWKKQLEAETLAKINSVLDPLLGSEKYRASVDIDCDQTSGEQSEETFDPTHSVVTTSQRTEEGSISRDTSGVPGTQSNLPRPVPRASATTGGGLARRSESMNYETSRLVKKLRLPQGIVRRMSVSVLLDQRVKWAPARAKGAWPEKTIEAPSGQEVKVIHDVVAAAAGFNSARGDQLAVDSLPFQATLQAQPPDSMLPTAPVTSNPTVPFWKQPAALIGMAALLILSLGVSFLMIQSRKRSSLAISALEKQLEAAQGAVVDASHELAGATDSSTLSAEATEAGKSITEGREAFSLIPVGTTKSEILTQHVAEEARKDPAALAQIIRSWLNEAKT